MAHSAGEERFKSDKRQFAGLMFALAICVTYFPLANIATAIGPDGTTPSSGLPLAGLISGCILVFVGSTGMLTGYLGMVHDYSNKYLTGALLGIIQLTWMPFLTDLADVGQTTASGEGFIPPEYNPTERDVKFVGSMGMIGILTYASAFVGSFAFMAFALFAFQMGKPTDRTASYYQSRISMYASGLSLAGLSQFLLGIYVASKFGSGPLLPAIGVAVYVVHYPEISIFVGLVQLLMGVWGLLRRFGILVQGKDNHSYQICAFFMWICMLSMQILTQVSFAPDGALAPAAPSYACLYLGISIMSPFLDYKMRNTPKELPVDYYGITTDESNVVDAKEQALPADEEMGSADNDLKYEQDDKGS